MKVPLTMVGGLGMPSEVALFFDFIGICSFWGWPGRRKVRAFDHPFVWNPCGIFGFCRGWRGRDWPKLVSRNPKDRCGLSGHHPYVTPLPDRRVRSRSFQMRLNDSHLTTPMMTRGRTVDGNHCPCAMPTPTLTAVEKSENFVIERTKRIRYSFHGHEKNDQMHCGLWSDVGASLPLRQHGSSGDV